MKRKGENLLKEDELKTVEKPVKQYAEGGGKLFKNKTWRWILSLEKFLQGSPASLGLTDVQILDNVNAILPREDRIGLSTWEALKGSDKAAKGVVNHTKWSDEQKHFVKEIIRMARSVKTLELSELTIDKNNKNSMGSFRILQAMNNQFQQNQQITLGGIVLNIEAPKKMIDLVETIDIDHEDLTGQKELQ